MRWFFRSWRCSRSSFLSDDCLQRWRSAAQRGWQRDCSLGDRQALGRHAPMVFEAAEAGSQLAHGVICDGGRQLAALIGRLQRQGAGATIVVAGGGVIAAQPCSGRPLLKKSKRPLRVAQPRSSSRGRWSRAPAGWPPN